MESAVIITIPHPDRDQVTRFFGQGLSKKLSKYPIDIYVGENDKSTRANRKLAKKSIDFLKKYGKDIIHFDLHSYSEKEWDDYDLVIIDDGSNNEAGNGLAFYLVNAGFSIMILESSSENKIDNIPSIIMDINENISLGTTVSLIESITEWLLLPEQKSSSRGIHRDHRYGGGYGYGGGRYHSHGRGYDRGYNSGYRDSRPGFGGGALLGGLALGALAGSALS